nr:integrase core domain-containing protein [Moraxella osloensis]
MFRFTQKFLQSRGLLTDEVQDYATNWLRHYNHERPHQANKGRPPLMAA